MKYELAQRRKFALNLYIFFCLLVWYLKTRTCRAVKLHTHKKGQRLPGAEKKGGGVVDHRKQTSFTFRLKYKADQVSVLSHATFLPPLLEPISGFVLTDLFSQLQTPNGVTKYYKYLPFFAIRRFCRALLLCEARRNQPTNQGLETSFYIGHLKYIKKKTSSL